MNNSYFESVAELLADIADLDDDVTLMWRNVEKDGSMSAGLWGIKQKYVVRESHFTDSFDFELYTHPIYLVPDDPDEFPNAVVCVQLGGEEKPYPDAETLMTAGDLKRFLGSMTGYETLIAVSSNGEHEGFTVKGAHLYYDSADKRLTLQFSIADKWRK